MKPSRAIPLVIPPDCETLHLSPGEYVVADSPLYIGSTRIVGSGWRNTVCRAADGAGKRQSRDLTRGHVLQDSKTAEAA